MVTAIAAFEFCFKHVEICFYVGIFFFFALASRIFSACVGVCEYVSGAITVQRPRVYLKGAVTRALVIRCTVSRMCMHGYSGRLEFTQAFIAYFSRFDLSGFSIFTDDLFFLNSRDFSR